MISTTTATKVSRVQDWRKWFKPLEWVLIALVHAYRILLGPLMGGSCRFEPSCSHYAEEALKKHGPFRGSALALKRLLKCHPWGPFGPDPVP